MADLKHRPFASLPRAAVATSAPAASVTPAPSIRVAIGRVIVREEHDAVEDALLTRVIGVPADRLDGLGKRWRSELGNVVLVEGRDLLVMRVDVERVAALVREAGAAEVAVVRRPETPTPDSGRADRERRGGRRGGGRRADGERADGGRADGARADGGTAAQPAGQAERSPAGQAGGTQRSQIRPGLRVAIVQKADQPTGALTEGVVQDILTSSPTHPRGIKVRLASGEVGRVRRLLAR